MFVELAGRDPDILLLGVVTAVSGLGKRQVEMSSKCFERTEPVRCSSILIDFDGTFHKNSNV